MLRFTWRFSVEAIVATINDLMITIGYFAVSGREFDLTALAAVLAVLGYSLNDSGADWVFRACRSLFIDTSMRSVICWSGTLSPSAKNHSRLARASKSERSGRQKASSHPVGRVVTLLLAFFAM